MKVTGHAVAATAHGVSTVAGSLGRFLPLLLIAGLIWLLMKLGGTVRSAGVAVADGYTGGAASRTKDAKGAVVHRAHNKGKRMRATREVVKGPQVQAHTGAGVEIISRANDQLGRPKRVTVCAPGPGDAQSALQARMGGRGKWAPAGSRPCRCKAAGHKDYLFVRQP